MMLRSCCVVLLLATCLAQRHTTTGERQIRLEDIERDNLAASQKTSSHQSSVATASSHEPQQSHGSQQTPNQHQLAAYQQQLLLQQLQQQYFAPAPFSYGNFGGVPLMIIPSNHLGVGSSPVPIHAYFVPADPSYIPQAYQPYSGGVPTVGGIPVPPPQRYQQPQREFTVPRLQPVSQDLGYNVQVQPSVQTYRQPQSYPSASVVYAGTPSTSTYQQPQTSTYQQPQISTYQQAYQQPNQQQLYNAYNALYQQRQEKNSFAAGVKSTPAPPVKSQTQGYSAPQTGSSAYSNYKGYNYSQ